MNDLQDAVRLAEATLEAAIEVARTSMLECQRGGDIDGARDAQAEMCRLIRQRTPGMVVRMEVQRGLR